METDTFIDWEDMQWTRSNTGGRGRRQDLYREIMSLENRNDRRREGGYDYEDSTAVQYSEYVVFIVLRRSTELRNRAGAKEGQIRM